LKDRLCDTLKELKTKNSNEGGVKESHTLMWWYIGTFQSY
jgi:hypothetical protein